MKDNSSCIKQFANNPIDIECGVTHYFSEAEVQFQASKNELCG